MEEDGSPMRGAGEKIHLAFALACHSLNLGDPNCWRKQCQFESSTTKQANLVPSEDPLQKKQLKALFNNILMY